MKRLVTRQVVAAEHAAGRRHLHVPHAEAIITPDAWSAAHELGVVLDRGEKPQPVVAAPPAQQGRSERLVDPSGAVVVRGRSVELTRFEAAGPGRNVRMADLITSRDGAPMTAGIMSWARADAFPWALDYDEVDLVLEGVLHVLIDGRTLEGKPGDVLYLPKGSRVTFSTPSRTKVFYVTYPADWASASAQPPRPQK
jgi:ethanolamine utilization protein EutQ